MFGGVGARRREVEGASWRVCRALLTLRRVAMCREVHPEL